MGHLPKHEYRKSHKLYMSGEITKKEFLRRYRDPKIISPKV